MTQAFKNKGQWWQVRDQPIIGTNVHIAYCPNFVASDAAGRSVTYTVKPKLFSNFQQFTRYTADRPHDKFWLYDVEIIANHDGLMLRISYASTEAEDEVGGS